MTRGDSCEEGTLSTYHVEGASNQPLESFKEGL